MIVKPIDIKIPKHCKPRPHVRPLGIVLHAIGQFVIDKGDFYAPNYLNKIGLSAHSFVEKNFIWDWIPENLTAWHAGRANNKNHTHTGNIGGSGFSELNVYYLGLEVMVIGHHDYRSFSESIKTYYLEGDQYNLTKKWVFEKMIKHSIPLGNVVMHSEVSGADVRPDDPKIDPGAGFPFEQLKTDLKEMIKEYYEEKKLVHKEKSQ